MAHKHCPHCLKLIPLKKRCKTKCPHCFRALRRSSQDQDRKFLGLWLEDRGVTFWFFTLSVLLVVGAVIGQLNDSPDLLNFIDLHTFWFVVSVAYLAMFASTLGRIYLPLMLGAPKILRRERVMIKQIKLLTAIGLLAGIVLVVLVVGVENLFFIFPATAYLVTIPIVLLWSYLGLALTDDDYDDTRTWSYLAEIGAADRFEFRYHSYVILIGLPLAAGLFYFLITHTGFAWTIRDMIDVFMDQVKHATKGKIK
jgi:hypothetical protein